MKAGLSHMGMGGTLEFIACGIPIVTWPHAEDQPYNAACIIENKAGVPLWTKERAETDYNKINTFHTAVFDA
jgi:UDP:flavonoid glycosyltransferase YjiC (YdhE family)